MTRRWSFLLAGLSVAVASAEAQVQATIAAPVAEVTRRLATFAAAANLEVEASGAQFALRPIPQSAGTGQCADRAAAATGIVTLTRVDLPSSPHNGSTAVRVALQWPAAGCASAGEWERRLLGVLEERYDGRASANSRGLAERVVAQPADQDVARRDPTQLALDDADRVRAEQPGYFMAGALLGPIGLGFAWAVAGDGTPDPEDQLVERVITAHGVQGARDYVRAFRDRLASRRKNNALGWALGGWAVSTAVLTIAILNAQP